MIAFEELSAALDRWRIRNGLPVVSADLPIVPDAERPVAPLPAAAPFAMPASAAATQPRPVGEDSDVLSIGDDEVVEDEAIYESDGDDFAMSFGGAPAPAAEAAPPPAPLYDEGPAGGYGDDAEQATYVAEDYQDPAYDTPQPLDAAEPEPLPEEPAEDDDDWSRMPNFPGAADSDPIDPDDDPDRGR